MFSSGPKWQFVVSHAMDLNRGRSEMYGGFGIKVIPSPEMVGVARDVEPPLIQRALENPPPPPYSHDDHFERLRINGSLWQAEEAEEQGQEQEQQQAQAQEQDQDQASDGGGDSDNGCATPLMDQEQEQEHETTDAGKAKRFFY